MVVANLEVAKGKALGISVDNQNVITMIEPMSCAAMSGSLMRGDTIVQLNGKQIEPTDDAMRVIEECGEQQLSIVAARPRKESGSMFQGRQRQITEGSNEGGSGRDSRNRQDSKNSSPPDSKTSGGRGPSPVLPGFGDNDGSDAMADLKLR